MTEPIYEYKRGQGWILQVGFVFDITRYTGPWFRFSGSSVYHYPEMFRDASIIDVSEGADLENGLKLGDWIPFNTRFGYVITGRNPTRYIQVYSDGTFKPEFQEKLAGYWQAVARL